MAYEISRGDVWAGEIEDQPGALACELEALQRAGVNLESAILRPTAPLANTGVLFLAPVVGPEQEAAARRVRLRRTQSIHAVRVAGPDRPGLLADIARMLSTAEIPVCGLTAASVAGSVVAHLRFVTRKDADRATELLREKLG